MNRPSFHPFHFRVISCLRDNAGFNTRTLPTDAVADQRDPEHARLSGYVLPEGYRSRLGYLALMLFIVAGTAAMASARSGIGTSLTHGLQLAAIGITVVSLLLLVVDNRREHRLARDVDVVVQASAADSGKLEAARIAGWRADANAELWIVSERGFTDDALARAAEFGARCFTVRNRALAEVTTTVETAVRTHHLAA